MIAVALTATLALAGPRPAPAETCRTAAGRVVSSVAPQFPDGAHPTRDAVRMLFDMGSDGRVRRVAVGESSGDPAVDLSLADALAQDRFAPPSYRCVTISTGISEVWKLPPMPSPEAADAVAGGLASSAAPGPSSSAARSSRVANRSACVAPFVRLVRLFPPASREPAGTAQVDVALDARAGVTTVKLARSSGNRRTDYAAAVVARTSQYALLEQSGCPAVPTTYRLELTFR